MASIPEISEQDYRKLVSKALTRVWIFHYLVFKTYLFVSQSVDMSMEMSMESMEIITMSVDKHQATKNYEVHFTSHQLCL